MTNELEPGYDPELNFNEGLETGYDIASQETQEQMANLLEAAGFDEDEIEEALYDPAPRRGRARRRKHHRSARRTFDPAPTKRRRSGRKAGGKKKGRRGKKSKLAKFRKFAMPAATVGSFYFSYAANAKARNMTIIDALKYDLANWSAQKTVDKISANPLPVLGAVGIPLARGYIPGANSGMMAVAVDVIHGILTGQALTQVIDEPAPLRSGSGRNVTSIQVQSTSEAPVSRPAYGVNPYM